MTDNFTSEISAAVIGQHVTFELYMYIDGLVQDCSNSSTLAMELLQSWF